MTASKSRPEYQFDLSGGAVCLDFANTVSYRRDPVRRAERLNSFEDLLAFARQSKIIPPGEAKQQIARALRHADDATRSLRKAIKLRESLYRAFSALARGKPASPHDVREINGFVQQALAHRNLVAANGGYRWQWQAGPRDLLDRVLWPVAASAAELLTSGELDDLRICNASTCGWLFLDRSRNHSRRWCDMKVCGNRQKARRHYQRARD